MTEEPGQAGAETSDPTPAGDASWGVRLYGRWLLKLEYAVVLFFFAAMVLGATLHLFDAFEEGVAAQLVIFATAFYLCLFGAVIATRRSHHIAVDAITPRLPPRVRRWIEGSLLLASGILGVYLTTLAYTYVFVTGVTPEASFLSGDTRWFWNRRLWYAPTVVGVGWMALHFLVIGGVRLAGYDPKALGITGQDPEPAEVPSPSEAT